MEFTIKRASGDIPFEGITEKTFFVTEEEFWNLEEGKTPDPHWYESGQDHDSSVFGHYERNGEFVCNNIQHTKKVTTEHVRYVVEINSLEELLKFNQDPSSWGGFIVSDDPDIPNQLRITIYDYYVE